ncbi:MAG: hypothetical protein P1P93_00360 [Gammaproteobacteria bacterium]|nr:hypothetical protein [Gammaproteobacteria bacterium]MDT8371504.1 hypothetical protein [Gammaproteobacteria bacterium]
MTFRSKFRFWLPVIIILAAVVFVAPAVSKTSLVEIVAQWLSDYNKAVSDVEAEDDDEVASPKDGAASLVVHIDDDVQEYSGIETRHLEQSEFHPETKAIATVVDLTPMLALRARFLQAQSEYTMLKVTEQAAAKEKTRLQVLAKATKSIASKNLVYAESAWREAKAKLDGVTYQLNAIREQANHTWGSDIAHWLLATESPQWQRLVLNTDSLLLVTLAIDHTLPPYVKHVRVAHNSVLADKAIAAYVSSAQQIDRVIQGETYFFKLSDTSLRTGMRLDVWYSVQQQPLSGVFVPEQAIVWNSGQAWAYVEVEQGLYQRRSLQTAHVAQNGLFVTEDGELKAGDQLIIKGAQMLLSEEFRWQILDEDDD